MRTLLLEAERIAQAVLVVGALGTLVGCGSDDEQSSTSHPNSSTSFDACMAAVTPLCRTRDLDTEEEMETACKSTEFIRIPLTDGTAYGPVTINGGPYGAKTLWNEGKGSGFENPVNTAEPVCLPGGIDTFREPAETTDDLKNTRNLDYALYTIFRPACMKDGEKYPVITWANGTCGLTHGYALLLGTVASHGFVIVASNSTWTATAPTNTVQTHALDYAAALNDDPSSDFYQRLDLDKIGAMGHSQGAAATLVASADSRVKSVILWNGGATNAKPFLNVSGDRDVGGRPISGTKTATEGATQPGAWVWYHKVLETGGGSTGHLVLMEQPDRVWEMAVAWWKWQLNGDQTAKNMFVGANCGLCNKADEFEYGTNSLLQ
jgi:chlorophyllase-like protein